MVLALEIGPRVYPIVRFLAADSAVWLAVHKNMSIAIKQNQMRKTSLQALTGRYQYESLSKKEHSCFNSSVQLVQEQCTIPNRPNVRVCFLLIFSF